MQNTATNQEETMPVRFYSVLRSVRFRQRIQLTQRAAALGLAAAGLLSGIAPEYAGWFISLGLALSFIFGMLLPIKYSDSVRKIDAHFHLQDRILTAFMLLHKPCRTPMEQIQIEDAAKHLDHVHISEAVPIQISKIYAVAAGIFVIDCILIAAQHFLPPIFSNQMQTLSVDTKRIRKTIVTETENLHKQYTESALQDLSATLANQVQKLETGTLDIKESLLTLSEMDETLQTAKDLLQFETMKISIRELGEAFELTEQTESIGREIEQGNYRQAASDLQLFAADTETKFSEPERKTLAQELKTLSDNAAKRHQPALQTAAAELSEALQNQDDSAVRLSADALADEIAKQGIRQEIANKLSRFQQALSMIKAETQEINGGKNTEKSKSGSKNWGTGTAGNPDAGLETELQARREQLQLTGIMSEQGKSLIETVDSNEQSTEQIRSDYQNLYQQYRKLSEAVLDKEPIPSGQRQIIRRYFETIHPKVKNP